MRLILTAAMVAVWMAPRTEVEAFMLHRRRTNTAVMTGIRMTSTMERPPTSPSSTAAAGHPFDSFGKPSNYSFGGNGGIPRSPGNNQNGEEEEASSASSSSRSSFESFAQGRQQPSSFNQQGGASALPPPSSFETFAQSARTSSPPSIKNQGRPPYFGGPPRPPQQLQATTATEDLAFTASASPRPVTMTANTNSFEEYLTSGNSEAAATTSVAFPGTVDQAVAAAAADPSAPLPPYMSPVSLQDASVRTANLPPAAGGGMFGSSSPPPPPPPHRRPPPYSKPPPPQPQAEPQRTPHEVAMYQQQFVNTDFPARPTPTGGLERVVTQPTTTRTDRSAFPPPSQELVGRLDQVLSQQRAFSTRLDTVETRIDESAVENAQRTQSLLEEFREDSKKTQEVFMTRINTDLRGMKTTIDKVLTEQQSLSRKQAAHEQKFLAMDTTKNTLEQKMVTLEKTTSIRSSNLEQAQQQATALQSRRIDDVITKLQTERAQFLREQQQQQAQQQQQRQAPSTNNNNNIPTKDELMTFQQVSSEQQAQRMEDFEKYQLARMTQFEDDQRQQLEQLLGDQQQQSPYPSRNQNQNPNGNPQQQQRNNGTPPPFPPQQLQNNSNSNSNSNNGNPPPFPPQQRNNQNHNGNPPPFPIPQQQQQRSPSNMASSSSSMDEMDYGTATEQQLHQRLQEAQSRKQQLVDQLRDMQSQEDAYHGRGPSSSSSTKKNGANNTSSSSSNHPPPPPFASRTDPQQRSSSSSRQQPPQQENGHRDFRQDHNDNDHDSRNESSSPPSPPAPKRSMLRDRLGKSSGEELYQPAATRRQFDDEDLDDDNDYDTDQDDYLSEDEKQQMQHERMMRRDPVAPPVEMGPRGSNSGTGGRGQQNKSRRTPPPPRGGVVGQQQFNADPTTRRDGMHADDDFLDSDVDHSNHGGSMRTKLGGMRAFKGDDQSPNDGIFNQDHDIGRRNTHNRGKKERNNNGGNDTAMMPPPPAGGRIHRKHGLDSPPKSDPIVDRKLEHFLIETMKDGPKPHFDKMMEDLLLEKYRPMFPWLKPGNVSFLRNVLITYLEHKGCQVDMDLSQSSAKATREWNQLLDVLSYELNLWTGETPKIIEEPDHQWGIYGSKNISLKTSQRSSNSPATSQQRSSSHPSQRGGNPPTNQLRETTQRPSIPSQNGNPPPNQRGVMSKKEAARRKQRNDKIFSVSADPTDMGKSMFN